MTGNGYFQLVLYLVALVGLAWPLGLYMARVYKDEIPGFMGWLKPVERLFYRLAGVRPDDDMPWTRYAFALLAFNLLGFMAVYALQRFQVWLPLNPEGLAAVTPDSSFNTAVSFATNTNWQGYSGETTMAYLTQMLGARRAELPLRRLRHGGAGGPDARLHPQGGPRAWAASGWT
jgi:K+-transporting ATPase ATPase A chain